MAKKRQLTPREYLVAIWEVAKLSLRTSPGAVSFKLIGAIINAVLPIVTTYFAALTTTALAGAFTGDESAGRDAIFYVIVTALLGLLTTVWSSIDQYLQTLMRYRVEAKVSDAMYEHFHKLEFWRYDDKDTADLYDKAQRFMHFYAYVFDRIAETLSSLVSVAIAIGALFLVVPGVAVIVLIAIIPGIYIQFKLSRLQVTHWNKNVTARRSRSFIEWNLLQPDAIPELRINGLVRHLLDLRQSLRDKDERGRLDFERKFILKRLGSDALESAAELAALIWITMQIIAGRQPVGQFIYVQQIVSRAISSANSFVNILSTIDEDLANLTEYKLFMSLPADIGGKKVIKQTPESIQFENVSFTYHGAEKEVLRNVSFEITAGQHIAIVGENGAGKSTLIKLVAGLYKPSKGRILLDEQPLSDFSVSSWHSHLSILQQEFQKYNFTDVKNNVVFGDVNRQYSAKDFRVALDQAEAAGFVDKLPNKEKTIPSSWMEDDDGEKGTMLSGGQWQRLALARNFYRKNASIIILDEPTSAIDALAEARIFARLFNKANKKTLITISHRMTTVEKADVILVIKDGKLVERGKHTELVAQKGEYYRMFESQLKR